MRPIRTILQPADFSPKSERAFELACQMARALKARIVVIHVASPAIQFWGRSSLALDQPRHEWRNAEEKLRSLECDDLEIECVLVPGEPAAAIIRTALEIDAGLIVMGSPRRSCWRWFHGASVAEAVALEAPCPVLTTCASVIGTIPRPGRRNWSPQNS